MQDPEAYLSDDLRARLRAPVRLSAGARARVMQRVRDVARASRVAQHPRGMARPTVLGALLAASFVAAIISGDMQSQPGGERATLADTIAARFSAAAEQMAEHPTINPARLVAVADETRQPPVDPRASAVLRRD